ncbi:MAG: hypothetical protein VX153_02955 [Verrucomicrobiota bacterium]|nr:hypothetical protein [Verrucomicrobiota bacterium]
MNRSLLLVVCDFLLLSILALARFDVPEGAVIAQDDEKVVSKEVIERISDGENYDDVVAELEATNETLLENLSSDKDMLLEEKLKLEEQIAERQRELERKEMEIAARDQVIAGNEEAIKEAQDEAAELAAQREEIAKKREELLKSNAASQKELELLAKNLEDAKKKSEELAALKEKTQKEAETAKVELAATLEKAKAEERAAAEAKAQLQEEKKRADALVATTAQLDKKIENLNQGLEGVGQDLKVVGQGLAGVGDKISTVSKDMKGVKETVSGVGDKVENIQKEVEETAAVQKENFEKLNERQTRSLNEIFTRYDESKIKLELTFTHKGGFLGAEKTDTYVMDTIIMVDGSFAYSLVHAKDSPFRLSPKPRTLVSVTGSIKSPKLKEPILVKEVAFMDDPRILIVPLYVNPSELRKTTSLEFFNAPANPHLFSEAVVVDSKQGRFGQTNFVRDEKDSRYIKVSHSNFAFLTGAFDPGKGDLVFSQKGELLGIMVNYNYAFHVKNLGARIHSGSRTVLGDSFSPTKTNPLLNSLGKKLFGLNKKFR